MDMGRMGEAAAALEAAAKVPEPDKVREAWPQVREEWPPLRTAITAILSER